MRLLGKVAVVTGGGGATGGAICRRLAADGARVIVNAHVDLAAADRTRADIVESGGEAVVVRADVTQPEEARRLVDSAVDQWGQIDILVNNVGGMKGQPFLEMSEESWWAPFKSNAAGTFFCCQAAAHHMIPRKYGRIVTIASLSYEGSIGHSNYAASKGAVVSLTRSLALELAPYNITVNCVAPGLIRSPRTETFPPEMVRSLLSQVPLRTMVDPIDVAHAVLFFASDEARYLTGELLHVSGGLRTVTPSVRVPADRGAEQ